MAISQNIKDIRCLRKLLKEATGMNVYKVDVSYYSERYWSISNEYADKTKPHITIAHGSYWSIADGAEYKISIYIPCLSVGTKKNFNTPVFQSYTDRISQALDLRFGENNWNACNVECVSWRPMSKCSYYIQIPNFNN